MALGPGNNSAGVEWKVRELMDTLDRHLDAAREVIEALQAQQNKKSQVVAA